MCGIVAYAGRRPALPILLDCLSALEYRGYDSAGVAVGAGDGLWVSKRSGKVADLLEATAGIPVNGLYGIGHTRWATHGAPTQENAHPHCDCTGSIALVHNGIIENYRDLRGALEADGHVFKSQTDTEVVVHLLEDRLRNSDLMGAVREAVHVLHGTYALAAVCSQEPNCVVGARSHAPLVAGLGDSESFLASDVTPLLEHTRLAIELQDGEVVRATPEGVTVVTADGVPVNRRAFTVDWDVESAEKSGYPDFMLKEIFEQPAAVRDALLGRTSRGRIVLDELKEPEGTIEQINRICIVACGSSHHAGLVAKYAFERWTRLPVEVDVASEFRYRRPVLDDKTLVVGVSQSGETADTLGALRYAKAQGAHLIAITNVVGSSITREAGGVIYTRAGPEIGVAATKTLTTQMVSLWLLALWVAQERKGPHSMPDATIASLLDEMNTLPAKLEQVLAGAEVSRQCAQQHVKTQDFLFIGRSAGYPVALEGALKLKEISYVHAEGYPAGEMKHGPIALLEPGMPVVVIATAGEVQTKLIGNLQEAKARGATIIAICNPGDEHISELADYRIEVPLTNELLSPVLDVVPLQLFAYHIAKLRGRDPDRPRNLAKSVTVE